MELRLTLLDPQHVDARVDVLVEAAVGTPLSVVRTRLTEALGHPESPPGTAKPCFSCNRQPLDESQPLGLPPLLQGAVLTVGPTAPRRPAPEAVALLETHVTAGPDAGTVVPLRSAAT